MVVQGFENSVEKMRVNKFLEAVDKITKCAGIKDSPDVTLKTAQMSLSKVRRDTAFFPPTSLMENHPTKV